MEFEVLSEKIKWEARRVAAAFGVKEWQRVQSHSPLDVKWRSTVAGVAFTWDLQKDNGALMGLALGERYPQQCSVSNFPSPSVGDMWMVNRAPKYHEQMARGLYRLGFEVPLVLAQLNHPLTAHEKLELRLSMPREFWPKTWLDEEGK
jgi:hypothetical protein